MDEAEDEDEQDGPCEGAERRLLLMRELPLWLVSRVWDTYLAEVRV